MGVRNQDDFDLVTVFDLHDFATFFVQKECGDVDRNLDMNDGRAFLHRFFLDDAENLQCGRFGIADMAGAVATGTGDVAAFGQGRAQTLARQFHQAETGDLVHLDTGTVVMQRFFQAILDFTAVFRRFHIDEVDDDQAAKIAQAQLAGDFFCRFAVGVECRGFNIGSTGGAGGVDVDGNPALRYGR